MSNRHNVHSIEFPLADALMLMEAVRLAGNRAMMSGTPDAEKRMRDYQARLNALIPEPARQFGGLAFCEMNIALADALAFEAFVESDRSSGWYYRSRAGRMVVRIGDRRWFSKNSDIVEDSETFTTVVELLRELAPLDCVRRVSPPQTDPQGS